MNLVFLGGPGAGKGTQAKKLATARNWPHISTGDMLREAREAGTEIGQEAAGYMDRGELVPDEVMCGVVAERLSKDDCRDGWILDGFPRTTVQADALDATLQKIGQALDACVLFTVDDAVLMRRLTGRRICSNCGAIYHLENKPSKVEGVCDACDGTLYQRSDDNEEAARNRLDQYEKLTREVVDFYDDSDRLRRIDAEGAEEEVAARLEAVLQDS